MTRTHNASPTVSDSEAEAVVQGLGRQITDACTRYFMQQGDAYERCVKRALQAALEHPRAYQITGGHELDQRHEPCNVYWRAFAVFVRSPAPDLGFNDTLADSQLGICPYCGEARWLQK